MTLEVPDAVADLPFTSHLVYLYVDAADQPPLFREIHTDLNMDQSTARNGLDRLLDAGLLDRRHTVRAPRGYEYYVPEGEADPFDDTSASGSKRAFQERSE